MIYGPEFILNMIHKIEAKCNLAFVVVGLWSTNLAIITTSSSFWDDHIDL